MFHCIKKKKLNNHAEVTEGSRMKMCCVKYQNVLKYKEMMYIRKNNMLHNY